MLHQFSWQQFLTAALTLSMVWYLALFLLFYRGRTKGGRSGKKGPGQDTREMPSMREGNEGLALETDGLETELMGKPKLPEGMSRIGSQHLLFAERNAEVVEWVDRGRRLGLVPDVIEELKDIFRVLEAEQGSKEDFMELFGLVREKYPGIAGTPEEKALNAYIRQNVLFPVSDAELDGLWS